jgi:hypothetical protein
MSKCIGLIGYWVFPLLECGTTNVLKYFDGAFDPLLNFLLYMFLIFRRNEDHLVYTKSSRFRRSAVNFKQFLNS